MLVVTVGKQILHTSILHIFDHSAILDAFYYCDVDTFHLLLDHADAQVLARARDVIDRAFVQRSNVVKAELRDMLMYRQLQCSK